MLESPIFAKNTERFIISSNSTKGSSNFDNLHYRINALFNTFIECVAQGLGICAEQINVVSHLHDSNRYSYAIQVAAKNTGGIINSLMIDHIFPTAMTCIKIKCHLSPTHQSAVTFQDDDVVLCNAYNQACVFEKDTWLLYKNNLEIDAAICKIVDCLSSKKGVQEIIFALGDDVVSLSGTKIFDVALPFKEYAVDYTETINTGLLIKKADFDCTGSWEFKSGNEIIKARIHPSQRKKLLHIVNTCVLGNRYLFVSLSLSCKLDMMGHCIPSTKKYEIINIFGEPRSTTERPELVFKINEYPIATNLTGHKQLYLI